MNFNQGKYHYEWFDEPVFERYEKVKVIDYCDCCESETGFHFEEHGVNQIGTKRVKRRVYMMEEVLQKNIMPHVVENILGENPFTKRLLGNDEKR